MLLIALAFMSVATFANDKPNIVVIFIDDMGYGDIGPFGSKNKTPHLNRMAKEGMKLTDFYVSSSACTPSRSALLTGCYADRIGMGKSVVFPADTRGLNPSEITIAEILKKGGYATGCFGKWHLGDQPDFMPLAQGFDNYEGIPYSNDMWVKGNPKHNFPPLPWIKQNKSVAHIPDEASQAEITNAITDAAVEFIKEHKDEPFFCYVPHSAVQAPHMTRADRLNNADDYVMAALISEIDNSTGRILQIIRDFKLVDNTFVLFTNDNGGAGKTSPGPLRGAKFGPKYEGHMRVATLAWWPGKIPAGSVSSEIMTTTDVLPTIASLTGLPLPTERIIDGKDGSDILLGKDNAKSPHDTLFYENDGIRQGKWKLVQYRIKADRFTELYDLEADLGEQNNIADQHPDQVKAMKAALDAHVAEIEKNSRPAGFAENPKPLLEDASGLPTLAEYVSGKTRQASTSPALPVAQTIPTDAPKKKRPDILFIAIDDMNDWTTLFDENNPIQTPNLKRLAERGTFFNRAYCASPGCNPSRTAIMTGLRPTTSGVYSNGQVWRDKIPNAISLPEYLARHGDYTTRGAGKIYHHGGTGAEPKDRPSFQEFFKKLPIRGPGKNKNYNGYRSEDKTPLANLAFDWGVHDQKMIDVDMCQWVEARMEEKHSGPLFLAAGIFNPHLPFYADAATFERYPKDKVKLPPMPANDMDDVGEVGI